MAREKAPAEVVFTIRRSIEVSPRGSRRVRLYRLRDLFGFQAWSPPLINLAITTAVLFAGLILALILFETMGANGR
jgi:hypothetical protein